MIYKTIREFINFKQSCPHCNDSLTPIIRVDGANNIYPNDNFVVTKVSKDPFLYNFRNKQRLQYKSELIGNHLCLDFYMGSNLTERVCEIDLDTNANSTSVKSFHKCLSTYVCKLGVACYKPGCVSTCAYYFCSDKLYVDYLNNKLYSTKLHNQMFGISLNNEYYILSSDHDRTLLTTRNKIVGDFPRIELKDLDSQSVIRKIKTLLVFG